MDGSSSARKPLTSRVAFRKRHILAFVIPMATLLTSGCLASSWRADPDVQATRIRCIKTPSPDQYACIESEAVKSLNPDVCRLVGKWIDDACLQIVYEVAGDPAICDRIYLRGVVPNCQAWYSRPTPQAGQLGERVSPDPALAAGCAPETARDLSVFREAMAGEERAFPHLCQQLGPPDWQTGSGLLILIYELADGSEVWLGYGGPEQLVYAILRTPDGQDLSLLPE